MSTQLDVKLELKSAAGDLPLTLESIRDVLSAAQAREVQRNFELDRPNGRALLAGDRLRKVKALRNAKKNEASPKGDPKRADSERKYHESFGKCRHCGGAHWHRDCPKRKTD
eukprot:6185897-Pleurochrysis_carterae.AAC.3